jgi:hypothetical protein
MKSGTQPCIGGRKLRMTVLKEVNSPLAVLNMVRLGIVRECSFSPILRYLEKIILTISNR